MGPFPRNRKQQPDTRVWLKCPICNAGTTTSLCAGCADALLSLGVPLPSPDATPREIAFWVRTELLGSRS